MQFRRYRFAGPAGGDEFNGQAEPELSDPFSRRFVEAAFEKPL